MKNKVLEIIAGIVFILMLLAMSGVDYSEGYTVYFILLLSSSYLGFFGWYSERYGLYDDYYEDEGEEGVYEIYD